MAKKLFFSAKVVLGLLLLLTIGFQSYFIYTNMSSVSLDDIVEFRNDPSNPQLDVAALEAPGTFEKGMILADKRESFGNFLKYNHQPVLKITIFLTAMLGLIALEKWFFWLLRKDEPVKARPDKVS
jgi:hypothetical protein